jgi:cytochrome P450
MSFTPFLGGKRICLGKTFAEVAARTVCPIILMSYDFEFVDPNHYHSKPTIIALIDKQPFVEVKLKSRI